MKNILMPIDDNSLRNNLLPYAVQLSKAFGAHLTLLRAYPVYKGTVAVGGYEAVAATGPTSDIVDREEIQELTEDNLKAIPGIDKINYDLLVEPGEAHLIIASHFEELQPDLLVVDSDRVLGLEGLFGLEAEVLSRKVPCSTLIIPRGMTYQPIKRIALALDKGQAKDEVALDDLIKFIEHFNSSLEAIHISDDGQKNYDSIAKDQYEIFNSLAIRLEHKNVTNFNLLTKVNEDITDGLNEVIHRKNIDLLVLLYRNHGFFKRIFNPGIRQQMIQEAGKPILILK